MERKICPLTLNAPAGVPPVACHQEECGWWCGAGGTCALAALAGSLFAPASPGGRSRPAPRSGRTARCAVRPSETEPPEL